MNIRPEETNVTLLHFSAVAILHWLVGASSTLTVLVPRRCWTRLYGEALRQADPHVRRWSPTQGGDQGNSLSATIGAQQPGNQTWRVVMRLHDPNHWGNRHDHSGEAFQHGTSPFLSAPCFLYILP